MMVKVVLFHGNRTPCSVLLLLTMLRWPYLTLPSHSGVLRKTRAALNYLLHSPRWPDPTRWPAERLAPEICTPSCVLHVCCRHWQMRHGVVGTTRRPEGLLRMCGGFVTGEPAPSCCGPDSLCRFHGVRGPIAGRQAGPSIVLPLAGHASLLHCHRPRLAFTTRWPPPCAGWMNGMLDAKIKIAVPKWPRGQEAKRLGIVNSELHFSGVTTELRTCYDVRRCSVRRYLGGTNRSFYTVT
jgi:hypothetical protein